MVQDETRIHFECDQEKMLHDDFRNENITSCNISWKSAIREAQLNILDVENKKKSDVVSKNDDVKAVGFG